MLRAHADARDRRPQATAGVLQEVSWRFLRRHMRSNIAHLSVARTGSMEASSTAVSQRHLGEENIAVYGGYANKLIKLQMTCFKSWIDVDEEAANRSRLSMCSSTRRPGGGRNCKSRRRPAAGSKRNMTDKPMRLTETLTVSQASRC